MMTEPFKINNNAIVNIERGKYREASSQLEKALRIVSTALSQPNDGASSREQGHKRKDIEYPFCRFISSGISSFRKSSSNSGDQHCVFQAPLSIYRPLPISDPRNCGRICYVIMYNLALAHHLAAMNHGARPVEVQALLSKALRLYEHAHLLLTKESDLDVPILNVMAIMSNLGHVHSALGEIEKAGLCYHNVLSTILRMIDCGYYETTAHVFDGFFREVLPLITRISTASAA
jgi:tetratricopeptide (TPR) repeat protein